MLHPFKVEIHFKIDVQIQSAHCFRRWNAHWSELFFLPVAITYFLYKQTLNSTFANAANVKCNNFFLKCIPEDRLRL